MLAGGLRTEQHGLQGTAVSSADNAMKRLAVTAAGMMVLLAACCFGGAAQAEVIIDANDCKSYLLYNNPYEEYFNDIPDLAHVNC
jgi:hypothetical protein